MNGSLSLAAAGLQAHARRLYAAGVAIAIGVAFVTASVLALQAMQEGVRQEASAGLSEHDLVVSPVGDAVGAELVDMLRADPAVTVSSAFALLPGERPGGDYVVGVSGTPYDLTLLSGAMPAAGQVVIDTVLSEATGWAAGDALEFIPTGPEGTPGTRRTAPISGVVDLSDDPGMIGLGGFLAPEPLLRSWSADLEFVELRLDAPDGDVAALGSAVARAVGGADVAVESGQQVADGRVQLMTGSTDFVGLILLGFGAVAMLTSAIVIATTFTIVLAQRRRELALLRCVGAGAAQLRTAMVLEAVLLGGAAATLGVALGYVGALVLRAVLGSTPLGQDVPMVLAPTPWSLLVPWLVGVLVTVVAAWAPTARASRVPPLAALRPDHAEVAGGGLTWRRSLVAVTLGGLGLAALVLAAARHEIPVGVAGGALSFAGVLVASPFVVPMLVRAVAPLTTGAGVPSRLARDNAVRNPGRVAGTSAALLVGVTLITLTSVGASSAARSAQTAIDATYAVDVAVMAQPAEGAAGPVPPLAAAAREQLSQVEGVQATTAVLGAELELSVADGWVPTLVLGIDPATAGPVLRSPEALTGLAPGTVGMSRELAGSLGVAVGDTVRLKGTGGSQSARVVALGGGWEPVLPVATLRALEPAATTTGLWLRVADGADLGQVLGQVNAVGDDTAYRVDGGAVQRAEITQVLDVLVLIASGLLGVAVVIALVGIANTLALSVIERGREHALLRALGLTRAQLRTTLALEGVLVALVSAVLGVALGIGYAWFGVRALLPADYVAVLEVPWTRVGLVVLVAVVAGAMASVLPSRRAARVLPAQGLAVP